MITVKQLKRGDFFTKKNVEEPKESQVWIRGDYIREMKKFECQSFYDANKFCYLKGDREVFVEFTF